MCNDAECQEMLIVLHIYLFLLPYDSSKMSLGDIESIVLRNQSREMHCDLSVRKFNFLIKLFIHLIVRLMGFILNN